MANTTVDHIAARDYYTDARLASIVTFEDALREAQLYAQVDSIEAYGNGFTLEKNKDKLINVPFLILTWTWHKSDHGDGQYVAMEVVTKFNDKLVILDGSAKSGIAAQLREIEQTRIDNGYSASARSNLLVPRGLEKSIYDYVDEDGAVESGTTYYLSR